VCLTWDIEGVGYGLHMSMCVLSQVRGGGTRRLLLLLLEFLCVGVYLIRLGVFCGVPGTISSSLSSICSSVCVLCTSFITAAMRL